MTRNGVVVDFTYIDGIPATISFGGNTFYYVVNGQGDVTAITDSQGNILITYYYDAWGSPYCTYNSATSPYAQSLFDLNPFRYRGYVYDWEVGLYYLQSRYYIPDVARFLNADNYPTTGQGMTGSNMFVYCGNNPINCTDRCGNFFDTIFDAVTLAASVVEVVVNPADPWAWAGLAGDAVDLIPFVTGVGESARAVKTTVKVVDKADDAIDTAKAVYKGADAASDIKKATGSYEIVYKSGRNYIGKGGFNRAISSAIRNANKYGDEVATIMWQSAPTPTMAFMSEFLMQKNYGGVLSSNSYLETYNKIWSPGRKYFDDWLKANNLG